MSSLLSANKTEQGWVVEMPPEMSNEAGVAQGSYIILYLSKGQVKAEILPPASAELKQEVREIADKFRDAFAEMKRRGD